MAAFDLASYDVTSHVADPKGNNFGCIICPETKKAPSEYD